MLTEYKRYCVTPAALKQTEEELRRHATANEMVLADKLKDTAMILSNLNNRWHIIMSIQKIICACLRKNSPFFLYETCAHLHGRLL